MTIPRVLLAAALLVLGFMILGIQRNMLTLGTGLTNSGQEMVKHLTNINGQLVTAHTKLDQVQVKLKRGVGQIGKPRVRAIPHLAHPTARGFRTAAPTAPAPPFNPWAQFFTAPQPPTTPPPQT